MCLNIGNYQRKIGNYDLALSWYDKVLESKTCEENPIAKATIYYPIAQTYTTKGNYNKALDFLFKSIAILDTLDNTKGRLNKRYKAVYGKMGDIYRSVHDYTNGLKYFKLALSLCKPGSKSEGQNCNNLGLIFIDLNQLDSAEYYYRLALTRDLSPSSLSHTYKGLGLIFTKKNEEDKAINFFLKSIETGKKVSEIGSITSSPIYLAEVLINQGKYKEALIYLFEYENQLNKEGNRTRADCKELILRAMLASENSEILNRYNEYLILRDSLFNEDVLAEVQNARVKYETEKKEIENNLLKKKKEVQNAIIAKQNAHLLLAGLGIGIIGLLSFVLYQQNNKKNKLNQGLKARINNIETVSKKLVHHTNGQFNLTSYFIQEKKKQANEGDVSTALQDTENWFNSLIAINRQLAKNNPNGLQDGLNEIVENMKFGASTIIGKELIIKPSIPSINTSPKNTLYLGLIINELITNSLKYAFDKQPLPTIELELIPESDGSLSLDYRDNGIGYKLHKIESGKGIEIISDMVSQLKGDYKIKTKEGFSFTATFSKFVQND